MIVFIEAGNEYIYTFHFPLNADSLGNYETPLQIHHKFLYHKQLRQDFGLRWTAAPCFTLTETENNENNQLNLTLYTFKNLTPE